MPINKHRPKSLSHVVQAVLGCGKLECDQIVRRISKQPGLGEQICKAYEKEDGQLVVQLINQEPAKEETKSEESAGAE